MSRAYVDGKKYCSDCYPDDCECTTTWYDDSGKVIETHEAKLRNIIYDLQKKLADYEKALEFYGNQENWYPHVCDKWSGLNTAFAEDNDPDNDVEVISNEFKGGKRAREVIYKYRGEK